MPQADMSGSVSKIAASLPYLRRYARALIGNHSAGDLFAARALEELVVAPTLSPGVDPKITLFRAFHRIWTQAGRPVGEADTALSQRARERMAGVTPLSREALLLSVIEGFARSEVAAALEISEAEVQRCLDAARAEMLQAVSGRVMIIEDEGIIALDLSRIVTAMGHKVTGIARTADAAVALARQDRPDLILADIQLAEDSNGIDAVNEVVAGASGLPVIFISGFPEDFLRGRNNEPAFLIAKPFTEEQVRSAISQAMFFSSTASLSS